MTLSRISQLTRVIERALFRINSSLSYDRLTEAVTRLADGIADYEGETEDWLYLNEFGKTSPDSILVGAFWHFTEWHAGQWSPEYAALSALGRVFSPGMTCGPEDGSAEKDVYDALAEMAEAKRAA